MCLVWLLGSVTAAYVGINLQHTWLLLLDNGLLCHTMALYEHGLVLGCDLAPDR